LVEQGFNGYLAKPLSNSQLEDILQEYTGYQCPRKPGDRLQDLPEIRDTRRPLRPSTRNKRLDCVSVEEGIRLAAGKADLAEELFSILIEQLYTDLPRIKSLWEQEDADELLECVHKLHGATRYCGVPELREAANQLETALKNKAANTGYLKDQLIAAIERLRTWSDETDWQNLFRNQQQTATS
jgi:two-component system sensor histidine kinase BarA